MRYFKGKDIITLFIYYLETTQAKLRPQTRRTTVSYIYKL